MKTLISLLFLIIPLFSYSQKVYSVQYDYQADIKVFVTQYDYQADLLVYKVQDDYQVKDNKGLWFFTEQSYQANKKVFFTQYDYQADLKIYFVNYDKNNINCLCNFLSFEKEPRQYSYHQ